MAPGRYSPEFRAEAVRAVITSSRTVAEVARELGMNDETLRVWVKAYRREHAGEDLPVSESERAELARLRKELRDLRAEKEFLGKGVPRTLAPAPDR